jgi:hypothetical protein
MSKKTTIMREKLFVKCCGGKVARNLLSTDKPVNQRIKEGKGYENAI